MTYAIRTVRGFPVRLARALTDAAAFRDAPAAGGTARVLRVESGRAWLARTPSAALACAAEPSDPDAAARPRTWGECVARGLGTEESPCTYVSCTHHLALDVSPATGSLRLTWADREPGELAASCALREVATNPDGMSLDEIATRLNVSRERVRQIEAGALARIPRELYAELRAFAYDEWQ